MQQVATGGCPQLSSADERAHHGPHAAVAACALRLGPGEHVPEAQRLVARACSKRGWEAGRVQQTVQVKVCAGGWGSKERQAGLEEAEGFIVLPLCCSQFLPAHGSAQAAPGRHAGAPVTMVWPSGETARYSTRMVCPVRVASFCRRFAKGTRGGEKGQALSGCHQSLKLGLPCFLCVGGGGGEEVRSTCSIHRCIHPCKRVAQARLECCMATPRPHLGLPWRAAGTLPRRACALLPVPLGQVLPLPPLGPRAPPPCPRPACMVG